MLIIIVGSLFKRMSADTRLVWKCNLEALPAGIIIYNSAQVSYSISFISLNCVITMMGILTNEEMGQA